VKWNMPLSPLEYLRQKKADNGRRALFGLFGLSCLVEPDQTNRPNEPDELVSAVPAIEAPLYGNGFHPAGYSSFLTSTCAVNIIKMLKLYG
jgi:hypothetical protein